MARRDPMKVGFALVLLVTVSSLHQTTADDKCRSGCGGVVPKTFRFQEGTTYQYNYEGSIDVQLSTAKGQHSETKVKATVLLTQLGDCNQVLRLQNVQILGDSKKFGSINDIGKPIKLNYHDGHLEDIICTDASDTQNSLNIKRAIASMFQAAVEHHNTEIDVFGRCPTEFSTHQEGNIFVIKKSRNLNKCAFRESINQDFMATAFDLHSEIKTSPFLQGQYSAEIKIKNGIFDHATVNEDYLYVPFSLGSEGAKAKVTSKLSFVKQTKETPKVNCNTPKSIIFEDPHPLLADKSVSRDLMKLIQETANAMDKIVKDNSANNFYKIIQLMKYAKKDELVTIYSQVRSGAGFNNQETARRVFLDALFRAGTGDAVEAAMDIYKSGNLNAIEAKLLFLSMAFTRHATKGSLKTAATLLASPDIPREVFLGIGALAGKYCRQHSCDNVPELTTLLNKLSEKLAKPNNRQNENIALAALKSIRNIGHVNPQTTQKIIDLAQDKQGSNRVRAAALDAYLADPCNDKFRQSALSILKDNQLDSEIRIKAYLAAAGCPNGNTATAIKTLLESEESYQVGGFIVSHLQTLRSSTNPDKAQAKAQLGGIRTTKKFPFNLNKFSRNLEISHRFDTFGLGGSAEANVIYSAKSYMARQVSLNLTTEVFGHTFNFLEVDIRQENLDKLLEETLRKVNEEGKKEVLTKSVKAARTLGDKVKSHGAKLISKREVNKNQIETFGKSINQKDNELNKDFDYDLSVKLFGSESLFLSLTDDVKKYTPDAILDKIFQTMDAHLNKAQKFDDTVNSNMQFLDTEVTYPTSMGFPLRLSLEGSSSVQMKMSGNLHLGKLFGRNPDGEYKLSMVPSASIQVAARFTIDAAVVQRGLKVTGNLYTATGGSIELTLGQKSVDLKYSPALDKQEIVTATHEIVYETREPNGHSTEVGLQQTQSKDLTVCLDQLKPFVGLVLCAHLNQPNIAETQGTVLPYPLNGNSKFSLTVDKGDLGHIKFSARGYDTDKIGMELVTEAVSNQNKPKATLKTELFAMPNPYFSMVFTSDIKKASVEARVVNKDTELSGFVKAKYDPYEYYAKVGVLITGNQQRGVYKPIMEFKAGQGNVQNLPYRIEGQIIVDTQGASTKYTLDQVKIVGIPNPITVSGTLAREPGAVSATNVKVTDGKQTGTLDGKVQYGAERLTINAKVTNTINPQVNFNVKYDLIKKTNELESSLSFQHGNLESKDNIFKVKNGAKWQQGDKKSDYETKNHMTYPALGIDNKFDLAVKEKSVEYDVEFAYRKVKLGSELDAKVNRKVMGDYDVEFEAHAFDNKIEIDMKRDVERFKSKVKNIVTVNGKTLDVSGDIKHQFETNRLDVGTDLTVKLTGHPDLKVKSELKQTPQDLDTSLKVLSGSKVLIDAFLKANKAGNANGNLKVTIDNVVTAQGQVKASAFKGNADLLVNVIKFDRKIKSATTFEVNNPTYNFDITLFTNFEKDKSRMYRLTTNNQIKLESIKTENTVEVLGMKTSANLKLATSGTIRNGKHNGEFDVTLPNEMFFTGKFNRDRTELKGIANGVFFINLEQRDNKNAQGRKFTFKGTGKNVDFTTGNFDIAYNLVLDDSNGKNLNGDVSIKGKTQGGKKHVDYNGKLYGSVIPQPLETTYTTNYGVMDGDYLLTTKYGKENTATLKGKFDIHKVEERKTSSDDFSLEIHTTSPRVKVVKINMEESFLIPMTKDDTFEYNNKFSMFIDDDGTDPAPILDFENKINTKLSQQKGVVKVSHISKKHDPISLDLDYDIDHGKKYHGDFQVSFLKGKQIKSDATVTIPAPHEYVLDFKLETPDERAKTIQIKSNAKIVPDAKSYTGQTDLIYNGNKYNLKESGSYSEHTPSFLFELTSPDGKLDKIGGKINSVGHRSISASTTIDLHRADFAFDGSLDVDAEDIEDFNFKLQVNSPKLKIDKLLITANTKETKGTNKLNVAAKMANQNIVSGTATYKTREEGSKFLLEGSGTFTVKNEKKSGNFKYTRNNLDATKDKEQGMEFAFQGSIGDKGLDSEAKFTNKHFRYLLSYCEQKKDCANIELDAKFSGERMNYKNVLEANIDLRKLGLTHEFGFKSESKRDHLIFDHSTDIHIQNKQSKYQTSWNVHPNSAGFSITTPKRIISLESNSKQPELGTVGPVSGEVAFYMNKKERPNEKTSLTYSVVPKDSQQKSVDVDVKFTHPALNKPLSVTYKSTVDGTTVKYQGVLVLIPNSDKKISFSGQQEFEHISEKVYGYKETFNLDVQPIKYKFNGNLEHLYDIANKKYVFDVVLVSLYDGHKIETSAHNLLSTDKASSKLVLYNNNMWDLNTNMQLTKEAQVFDSTFNIIGLEPLSSHLEVKNFNTFKFNIAKAATKDPKLEVNSAFAPGQIADFRVDFTKGGKKVDLLHASVKLDETNFMKSDYGINTNEIKELIGHAKEMTNSITKETSNAISKGVDDSKVQIQKLSQNAQQSQPNLNSVGPYYEKEFKSIQAEIDADPTLKALSASATNIVKALISFMSEMTKTITGSFEKIAEIVKGYQQNLAAVFEKDIVPKLKETFDAISAEVNKVVQKITDVYFGILGEISKFIDAHQAELKQIATTLTTILQDTSKFLVKIYGEARTILTMECKKVYDEIMALPYVEKYQAVLKQIKDGVPVPEHVIQQFQGLAAELSSKIPFPELKNFVDLTTNYIVKKMKQEKVDDFAEIKKIFEAAGKAVTQIVEQIKLNTELGKQGEQIPVPFGSKLMYTIPKFIAGQFSTLNRILNGDIPTIEELMHTFTLNPTGWDAPYWRYAVIAQGQHIFTFDGKHMTFPGKCNYMLARDINGEFSIVGTYSDGILTELSFYDKTDVITIKKTGVATLNGAATELPIRGKLTDAFRLYTEVHIKSNVGIEGVEVFCAPDLSVCVFGISGFYHGRVRGLLGNANFEAFDDYMLPNGKIVGGEAEFGNAYKMQTNCQPVKTVDHNSHHRNEECTQLFSDVSSLSPCFPIVRPDLFRQACDHGMAGKVADTMKSIAGAYAATCATRGIPVALPKEFVKCTNGDKDYELWDIFSVKTPQKAADVVFAIDVDTSNQQIYTDLITQLGPQLTKDLGERGIKDVEFHIITYGGDQPIYPSHVTTNQGKLAFKGKFPTLKFSETADDDDIQTDIKQLDFFLSLVKSYIHDFNLAIGNTPQSRAYVEGIKYPFRAHAVKTIVAVTTGPCETGALLLAQKLRAVALHDRSIMLNVFTSMNGANFKVKDDKTTKNTIGFNRDGVFTFNEAKKKPTGNPSLVSEVSYNDFCSEFTARGGGNIFVTDNFKEANKQNKKLFVSVAAYNIAESLAGYEQGLDCVCARDGLYTASNKCTVVNSSKKAPSNKKIVMRG